MDQIRATWNVMLGDRISTRRIGGYGLLWLWTIMMFNSIVPYASLPDPRSALYTTLTLSLVTMVVTMLFIAVALRRSDALSDNAFVLWAGAGAMGLGSVLTAFSDPNTSAGMGVLVFSSILTGSGSAALFVCWGEQFFGMGGRVALVELSVGSCVAFIAGFVLIMLPAPADLIVVAATPLGSAWLLARTHSFPNEEGESGVGGKQMPMRQNLSRSTIALTVKALMGALLVGLISGFFDVMGGFNAYVVTDIYGVYLLLAGCMATLLLSLIAALCVRDGIFYAYRFSVLVLCLGCLLTPFLGDESTYFSTLVFAGYTCFTIILYILCIDVATGFRVNVTYCLGLSFVALYGGEVLGHLAGYNLGSELDPYGLALLTLLAVSLLLVAHLFLFTEIDLIKLGIGEASLTDEAAEAAESTAPAPEPAPAPAPDPAPLIIERYGLTPRESDVLPLLLEGRTIQRIQETLFISAGTVSTHIRHIYQKTGADNRQELIDLSHRIVEGDQESVDGSDQAK